jgi:hypothetical protein
MLLIGIVLVVMHFARRPKGPPAPGERRSHRTRNAYLAVLLVLILICGSTFYIIYPDLAPKKTNGDTPQFQHFITPDHEISLLPYGVINNSAQAYPNGQITYLGGNFTALSGEVLVVIIPNAQLNAWTDELRNGTVGSQAACAASGNVTLLYDSGDSTSGAFSVQIPAVGHDSLFDLVIADPSSSTSTTVSMSAYYGLPG